LGEDKEDKGDKGDKGEILLIYSLTSNLTFYSDSSPQVETWDYTKKARAGGLFYFVRCCFY
jgi:hypothetical protein